MALMKCFRVARRGFHTAFRPPPLTKDDRSTIAKHALLAFNVMISQKIKPDIFMYTNLIRIMGDAGLEWQAYKLFARMLEQGVTPLPETYAALKLATHPRRIALHNDISRKLEERFKNLPAELAHDLHRKEEAERLSLACDLSKMQQGNLIDPSVLRLADLVSEGKSLPASSLIKERAENETSMEESLGKERNESYATLKIENPSLTWDTFNAAQEAIRHVVRMSSEEKAHALSALSELHEDELRIFLTIARQLRHGTRDQLMNRIIENIPYNKVMAMISRRVDFFISMRKQFKDLMQLQKKDSMKDNENPSEDDELNDSSRKESILESVVAPNHSQGSLETRGPGKSVNVLYTPWGFIKEPIIQPQSQALPNPRRDAPLLESEIEPIVRAAQSNELDKISPRLLRKFARANGLKWKRRDSELYESVKFHILQMDTSTKDDVVAQEKRPKVNASAEPMEMLRAIVRYSAEVKAVDDPEINKQIKVIMEKQRAERIKHELERNKENSRSRIPLLVQYRMRKLGMEPVKCMQDSTHPSSSDHHWRKETAEEYVDDQSSDSTDVQGADCDNASPRSAHQDFSETTFGRFRRSVSSPFASADVDVSRLEAGRDSLLLKKQSRNLNRGESRKLKKYKVHIDRFKRTQKRAACRKESPPLIRKPRIFMAQRL